MAGGEEVTEGAVVVVEMILRGKLLGFRGAVDEGVTEGTVVVEETSTNGGCGGGILGGDTGVGASGDVSIVVAVWYNVVNVMASMQYYNLFIY